jgi:hypothetical protein
LITLAGVATSRRWDLSTFGRVTLWLPNVIHTSTKCLYVNLFMQSMLHVRIGSIDYMVNLSRFASDPQIDKP